MRRPFRKRTPQPGSAIRGARAVRPTPRADLPSPRITPDPTILAHEAASMQDFIREFDTLLSILTLPRLVEAMTEGDLAAILDILDLLEWANFEARLTATVTPRVVDVIQFEGQRSFDEIRLAVDSASVRAGGSGWRRPPGMPPTDFSDPPPAAPSPRSGFYATARFDMNNPYAVRSAEQFAATLVREVSRSTRRAIRDAVVESFNAGITGPDLARRLRNTIGLTSRQAAAVENYRERLLRGGMDEERVEVLTRRYWRKTRNRRAETIARTEIMRASNHGRMLGWQSAADAGLIDLNASVKEWVTAPKGVSFDPTKPVVCSSCAPMDGKKVMGAETPFHLPGGTQVQMPPAHPNCRCTAILHPPAIPEDWDETYPYASVAPPEA